MSRDRYETKWVFDLGREYVARHRKFPLRPSHWDSDPTRIRLPPIDWEAMQGRISRGMQNYSFFPEEKLLKTQIADLLLETGVEGLRFALSEKNVSVQSTSTLALFLALMGLRERGARRALVISPVYFSVWDSCEALNYETKLLRTDAYGGGLIEPDAVLQAVEETRSDVLVVTNPTFPLGRRWSPSNLAAIIDGVAAHGSSVLLDASQSGLHWVESRVSPRVMETDGLIIVQSPSKSNFLHGARFAHTVGPRDVVEFMDEMTYVVGGATSVLQREVAREVYSSLLSDGYRDTNQRNVAWIRESYREVARLAHAHDLVLTPSDSGTLTMVHVPDIPMTKKNETYYVEEALWRHHVHLLPGSCFRVVESGNWLCFRLSLVRPIPDLLAGVRAVARVQEGIH